MRLRATDKAGRFHDLRDEVLRVAESLGTGSSDRSGELRRHTIVLEGLTCWTYEGREGHGIAEYLHQLDAEGRPLVSIE